MRSLKKHKLLHKVLSSVLAAAVVVSMVPTYSFADEAATEATVQAATVEETTADDAVVEDAEAPAEDAEQPAEDAEAPVEDAEPTEDAEAPAEDAGETAEEQKAEETNGVAVQAETTTTITNGNAADFAGAWKDSKFKPGTYTVTANIKMPGQYNPVLTGVDVYANNPNNPFGPTLDPDDPVEDVKGAAPTEPLENNATLTVAVDGTLTLNLPIHNPIFTTQNIGTSTNVAYTATRLVKAYTYGNNSIDGRIYKLDATLGKVELGEDKVATYTFKGSELYALPLNMTFKPTGDIALQLDVDLSTIPPAADYSAVEEALKKVPADLSKYTEETANAVTAAVEAVDYTKGQDEQDAVDAMAKAIEDAVKALRRIPGLNEPTRTEQLDLNKVTTATDLLSTEGWKWEPTADGGTLTLRDFYLLYSDDNMYGSDCPILLPEGAANVRMVLEGTNIVETSNSRFSALIADEEVTTTLTVSESGEGGSLEVRLASGTQIPSSNADNPYVFGVNKLVLESGTLKTDMSLGTVNSLEVQSGLLEVDMTDLEQKSAVADKNTPICVYGDITMIGGKIKVTCDQSYYGIEIYPLLGASGDFKMLGDSSIEINGANYGVLNYGGKSILLDTTGDIMINSKDESEDGVTVGIFAYLNEKVEIKNIGSWNVDADRELLVRDPEGGKTVTEIADADYTAVDNALAKIPEDLSAYSASSAQAVNDAKDAVVRGKNIIEQKQVDAMAAALEEALNGLEKLTEKPTVNENLVYTGKTQTGVDANDAYTVENGSAVDADNYTATVKLNPGYAWADGSRDDVTIAWSIAKADPTFTAPTGLTATEGQTLSDVKLPKGFTWADKTESVGAAGEHSFKVIYTPDDTKNYNTAETTVTVKVEKKAEDDTLKPGTYRVTANLFLPGEKNTQLPGVTAYMTNPNNPLGIKPDNMPEGWNFESAAPTTPAENNATLVVKEDGTRVVILDVVNPVFTLQSIKSGSNVTVLEATKDSKTYADATGTASRTGRVVKLYAQLGDDSGHYYFGDCVEFPTLLGVNWNVALEMGVDFASVKKLSDSTDTGLPGDDNADPTPTPTPTPNPGDDNTEPTPTPAPTPTPDEEFEAPVMASGKGSTWEYGSNNGLTFGVSGKAGELLKVSVDGKELGSSYYSVSGSNVTLNASFLNTIAMGGHTVTLTYQGGSVSADFTTKEVEVVKIKPGTYTVSANIWFEKADSGLPMNPHLTNSTFPPKDPVSNNATLVVDETGRALVTVPIVIQSKVMTIQQITGLNIVSSTTDGNGNLTSITVDLGILEDFNSVITQTCSVRLKMGDLAMSISGSSRDHTWRAQFQVNLSGVPTTTGTATVGIGQNGQTLAPKTGSESPVAAASALVISAAACIALLVLYKKQRKQNG